MIALNIFIISAALVQTPNVFSPSTYDNTITLVGITLPQKIYRHQEFTCNSLSWHITYTHVRNDTKKGIVYNTISGHIVYFENGKGRVINEAQDSIFGRLSNIMDVSNYCDGSDGNFHSPLLLSGWDKETDETISIVVTALEDGTNKISYEIVKDD